MFKIQFYLFTNFGNFTSEEFDANNDQYNDICELSKEYYKNGFEMKSEDGSYIIFPPAIVQNSILQIKKIKNG